MEKSVSSSIFRQTRRRPSQSGGSWVLLRNALECSANIEAHMQGQGARGGAPHRRAVQRKSGSRDGDAHGERRRRRAPPPPPTAGQAALAASRAAKAAKLAEARANGTRVDPAPPREFADVEAARRASWSKTGIVGLRNLPRRHPGRGLGPRCVPRPPSRDPTVVAKSRRIIAESRVFAAASSLRRRLDILVRQYPTLA